MERWGVGGCWAAEGGEGSRGVRAADETTSVDGLRRIDQQSVALGFANIRM